MTPFKTITQKEANERFQLADYIHTDYGDDHRYVLMEGDVKGDGSLNLNAFCSSLNTKGIIVDGNLTITGTLSHPELEYGETIFVTGNLHAKSISKGAAILYIKGNLVVEQTLYGFSNHGRLTVDGNTEATTIFAEDQHFIFGGDVQGLLIDTGKVDGTEADFYTTEPLLDELISNEKHSDYELLLQYIEEDRPIIKEQYRARVSVLANVVANNTSVKPMLITGEAASRQFDVSQYKHFGDVDFEKVIFFNGDVYLLGDLDQSWAETTIESLSEGANVAETLILINGNLTVAGIIKPSEDIFPYLLVIGNVQCDILRGINTEFIHITGDADITFAYEGCYNDGSITIDGTTRVPYVISCEPGTSITPEGAILINDSGDYDDPFEYDYTIKDLQRVMVPAVFDEIGFFERLAFFELLKAGKSPLKKGMRPARLL